MDPVQDKLDNGVMGAERNCARRSVHTPAARVVRCPQPKLQARGEVKVRRVAGPDDNRLRRGFRWPRSEFWVTGAECPDAVRRVVQPASTSAPGVGVDSEVARLFFTDGLFTYNRWDTSLSHDR